jgi:transcriptional regulator with XRE-family HTH domain
MIFREIGRRIQQAREERGLTQEELAAKLGCTQSALSNYELGKRRLYLSGLEHIARVLDKPLSYFMEMGWRGTWTELPSENNEDDESRLLDDPQLREILRSAAHLSAKEKKLVLDFINWRRSQK